MELLLLVAGFVVFGVLLSDQRSRIRRIEDRLDLMLRRLDSVEDRVRGAAGPAPVAPPAAPVEGRPAPPPSEAEAEAPPSRPLATPVFRRREPEEVRPARSFSETFEALVGGKLPIWIGGIALVLSAFFLVRYSIEAGLLGPGPRSIIAGLFGLALLAAAEAGRRLPRFAGDPRVGQALAGAGIASLFGTLYMASELYGLIGPLAAFGLLVLVTAAALFLSLRHGPPTAIMGLIGGFAAPYVAGLNDGNLVPVLVYLALLMAGLFALAVHRGWLWLALAATGGGALWTLLLLVTGDSGQFAALGAFVAVSAIAATAVLPRAGGQDWRIRLVPMAAGLMQLALLAPLVSFSMTGWAFYGLLSAAMIALAWRDPRMTPGVAGALALVVVLLAAAHEADSRWAVPAAAGALALFGIPGHWLARRSGDGHWWSAIAVAGGSLPLLIAMAFANPPLADWSWGLLALAAAIPCTWLSMRARADASPEFRPTPGLAGALGMAMLLVYLAAAWWLPALWHAPAAVAVALGGAIRAERDGDRASLLTGFAGLALAVLLMPVDGFIEIAIRSLPGETLHLAHIPPLIDVGVRLALPAAIIGVALVSGLLRADGVAKTALASAAAVLAGLVLYALAKQPLAIVDDAAFVARGFAERALISQALFAAAAALLWKAPAGLRPAALALLALGVARVLWFDLLVLNPLHRAQEVGSLPLVNAAVIHFALVALWLWLAGRLALPPRLERPVRIAAIVAAACTMFVAIRQLFQGSRLDADMILRGEQYAYSAGFLLLGALWLWRGIRTGSGPLRVTGLIVLTLVTFKVFLIDASALEGLLRVLSFLGLGAALIGIGWGYGRFVGRPAPPA